MNKNRALRFWVYFKRAHNAYFVYMISFINFMTITYTLLLVEVLGLPKSITYYVAYAVLFTISYSVLAILVGRWDYRRGAVPVETELVAKANPWVRDLARALYMLADGRRDEVKRVLEKWFK